jgi:hypothetical protein
MAKGSISMEGRSYTEVASLIDEGEIVAKRDFGFGEVFQVDHPDHGSILCGIGASDEGFIAKA